MGSINTQKAIVGGLVAGFVLTIVNYLLFTYVIGAQLHDEMARFHPTLPIFMAAKRAIVGRIGTGFVLGIATVWLYAAIRPRFGPGPRSAMLAAFAAWVVLSVGYAPYYLDRMMSLQLWCMAALLGLVSLTIASLAGAKLYTE
jgi:hypothetical protein